MELPTSIKDYLNVVRLGARIKALETELTLLKRLQAAVGGKKRGRKPGRPAATPSTDNPKDAKRGKRGKVKAAVLAYLQKNREGKAIEIARLSGLKVTSVHQTLFALKKSGHVVQNKKRGSPFVLAK